jgi:membrane protease YdiL (CAAX protease family)
MNPQDDHSSSGPERTQTQDPLAASPTAADTAGSPQPPKTPAQFTTPGVGLSGDPIDLAARAPAVWPSKRSLPVDLQISWSWLHLVAFTLFGVFSFAMVQVSLLLYYVSSNNLKNQAEIERMVLSKPMLAVGTMVIWYGLLLLFLYVTLAVFQNAPFWRSLGWRKLGWKENRWPKNPWLYLGAGCILSLLVFAATAKMQPPENVPIEELFKYKNTAMMFMAMAVLVAPLVEETVFRGYLYPLFAKSFGVATSIAITGILFGLMHGAQLGWTWGLVTVLIVVGIVFTFVRARTGSVFASFLLHLGYNSMIAVFTVLGTEGFSKIPPTH